MDWGDTTAAMKENRHFYWKEAESDTEPSLFVWFFLGGAGGFCFCFFNELPNRYSMRVAR